MSEMEFRGWPPAIMNLNLILPWSIVRPVIFRFMEKSTLMNSLRMARYDSLPLRSFLNTLMSPEEMKLKGQPSQP